MKPRTSSKFSQIRPPSAELAVLEHLKNPHLLVSAVFDRIVFILAGNDNMHTNLDEFEFRPYPTIDYAVSCPYKRLKNRCSYLMHVYF